MNCLPNFFVVGTAKAGTTSLYNYLKQHPDIFMCPVKEPNFFSDDIDTHKFRKSFKAAVKNEYRHYLRTGRAYSLFVRDYDEYLGLFKDADDLKAIGEMSNSYLYSSSAAYNIKANIPNAKILICLRDPVDRLWSHYKMELSAGATNHSFMDAINKDIRMKAKGWGISHMYLELGFYSEHVKRYLDLFGRKRVKIFKYEEMEKPDVLMNDIFYFLGVSSNLKLDTSMNYNVSFLPRNKHLNYFLYNTGISQFIRGVIPNYLTRFLHGVYFRRLNSTESKMPKAYRKWVLNFYLEDMKKLTEIIDFDISKWMVDTIASSMRKCNTWGYEGVTLSVYGETI